MNRMKQHYQVVVVWHERGAIAVRRRKKNSQRYRKLVRTNVASVSSGFANAIRRCYEKNARIRNEREEKHARFKALGAEGTHAFLLHFQEFSE